MDSPIFEWQSKVICNFAFSLSQGGETHKPGYGSGKFYEHKYAHKGHKGYRYDGQGTLSKFFKLVKIIILRTAKVTNIVQG